MPAIDVVDSTWICAPAAAVAPIVADPANWVSWWPDLVLTVDERRGEKGVRWFARTVAIPALLGSMEVWLEPAHDGLVAHYFLRLDRADGATLGRRCSERIVRRHRNRTKQAFWALGDHLDPARLTRVALAVPSAVPGLASQAAMTDGRPALDRPVSADPAR